MLKDDAHALRGHGVAHVVVTLVVEVVVSLEPHGALPVEEVFEIEVADKVAVARVVGVIAIADVAVKDEAVVEQLAGERHIDLDVAKVATVGAEVGRNGPIVAQLAQHGGELRRDGGGCHRGELAAGGGGIGVHVIGRVEAVKCEQVDDLSVHHVVGADDALHLAVGLVGEGGELEVEGELGLGDVALDA